MKMMNLSLLGAALVGLSVSAASAADTYTLKISVDSPSQGNVCKGLVDVWADKVTKASDGRLQFELYCDGILSKVGDTIDRVAVGVADIGWDLPSRYGSRFRPLSAPAVPGTYNDPEIGAGALWKVYEDGTFDLDMEGARPIWFQFFPNVSFFLKEAPKSHTDMAPFKIGVSDAVRARVLQDMGGVPLSFKPPEYYQALSKGAADGVQSTVGAVAAYAVNELTHYYLYGPFGGGMTIMVINEKTYDSLPEDLQKILDENTGYEASRWASAYLRDYEDNFMKNEMLTVEGNVQEFLTDDDIAAWQPAFDQASATWLAETENGQVILDAFKAAVTAESSQVTN